MLHRIQSLIAALTLALSVVAAPVWALDKDEAKTQGLVGERADGYLGIVVAKPAADVVKMVDEINALRKAAYEESASSAGVERSVFELRMGQRLQERAPAGEYIQLQNGNWKRK